MNNQIAKICSHLVAFSILSAVGLFSIRASAATVNFIQRDFEKQLLVLGKYSGDDQNGNNFWELAELDSFSLVLKSVKPNQILYEADLSDLASFFFDYERLKFTINSQSFEINFDATTVAGNTVVNFDGASQILQAPLGLPVEELETIQSVPESSSLGSILAFSIFLLFQREN